MPASEIDPIWFGGNALCAFIGGGARNAGEPPVSLGLIAGAGHGGGDSEFLLDRFHSTAEGEKTLRVFRLVNQTENVALLPLSQSIRAPEHTGVVLSREPLSSEDRALRFVRWRTVFVWFSRNPGAAAIEFETVLYQQQDLPERAIAAKRRSLEAGGGCVVLVLAQCELDSVPTARDLQKGRVPQRVIEAARVVYPASISDFRIRAERLVPRTDPRLDEAATCIRDYAWSETPPLNVIHVDGEIGPAEGYFVLLNRRGEIEAQRVAFDEKSGALSAGEAEQRAALHAARRFVEAEPALPLVPAGTGAYAIGALDGRTLHPRNAPFSRDSGWLEVRSRADGHGVTARVHGASFKDEIGFFVRAGEGRALRISGRKREELVTHCLFEVTEHGLVPSRRRSDDPLIDDIRRRLDTLPADRPQKMLAADLARLDETLEARLSIYKEIESVLVLRAGQNAAAGWRAALDQSLARWSEQKSFVDGLRFEIGEGRAHVDPEVIPAALDDFDEDSLENDPILRQIRTGSDRSPADRRPQPSTARGQDTDRLHLAATHLARNFETTRTLLRKIRKIADLAAGGLVATQFERNFSEALDRIWQEMPDVFDRDLHTRFHFDREPNASDAFVLFAASAFVALARKVEASAPDRRASVADLLSFGDFFRHPALVEAIVTEENLAARMLHLGGARIEEPNAELAVQLKHALGLGGSRARQPTDAQVEK